MKIPLNWLKEYVKIPSSESDLTHKLSMVGHMLDKKEVVDGQTIIDLELRGNRADCYSILGIAREISALYNTPVKNPKTLPKLNIVSHISDCNLTVKTPLVKRVMMVVVKDVKIMPSPKWLTDRLKAYGVDPINNIVDLTNYVMIETGEPMHAFDLDKIGKNLEIRLAKNNEVITTFQDIKLTLTSDDLVWAGEDGIYSVAGAIGGRYHSIGDGTKNILVEAAGYDRANIRRTVHRHNLLTDAGIRHEKELDPNLVETAFGRFIYLIKENGWGKVEESVFDYYPKVVKPWKIKVSGQKIKNLGGVEIASTQIKKILKALNFQVVSFKKIFLEVLVPTYRTDVVVEEDVIEEILRIYGYDNIPVKTLSLEIPSVVTPKFIDEELSVKNQMVGLGFNEVISSTFVKEKLLNLNLLLDEGIAGKVELSNPPSPDNKTLRMTLLPNLFEFVEKIINERGVSASLFEVGKIYFKDKGKYIEKRKLGIISWNKDGLVFTKFKGLIDAFFLKNNIRELDFSSVALNAEVDQTFSISIDREIVGYGGKINDIYFCEIDLDAILEKVRPASVTLWPKYPPQIEDHNFVFPKKTKIGEVIKTITTEGPIIKRVDLVDVFKDTYTFRFIYQDSEKTLNDEEVGKVRNKILQKVKEKFGGQIKE
jgi:phenylalanyl-tRNA synthetase beta chain